MHYFLKIGEKINCKKALWRGMNLRNMFYKSPRVSKYDLLLAAYYGNLIDNSLFCSHLIFPVSFPYSLLMLPRIATKTLTGPECIVSGSESGRNLA
jgi:hypothetical protein